MATETPNVGNVADTQPPRLAAAVQTGAATADTAPLGGDAGSSQGVAPSNGTTFATPPAGNSLQTLLPAPSGTGFGPSATPAAGGGFFQSVFGNQS
jgi:hypothetical protein